MDIQRIRTEVMRALTQFALVEAHPTTDGGVFVKAGLQTSIGNTYIAAIHFPDYPNRMPSVQITKPAVRSDSPHRYNTGHICYLHPSMWNPGRHDLTFVLARIAKWLNKYDIWCHKGHWPGAEVKH
jgi:ubiquitin-protein ligase